MTALVTGGGGFLGSCLVGHLLAQGETVRVICRGDYPHLHKLDVEIVRGDIRDAAAVDSACQGVETVYHTAAVPGFWGPWQKFYSINTVGTRNLLTAAKRQEVEKFIFTSSPSVVFDGHSHHDADETLPYPKTYLCHYPHSKALAERDVLAAHERGGLQTVALRPHLIWGPHDPHIVPRLIARARSGRLRRIGAGRNLVSMCFVENAAGAHYQAAKALGPGSPVGGKAYFITDPEPVNLWAFIDTILDRAGLPRVKSHIPERAAYRLGAGFELLWKSLRLPGEPPMTRFVAAELSHSHTYSIAAAQRDFHYAPTVGLEEGLDRITPELQRLAAGETAAVAQAS